jgi:DNA-binding MarR family transcriptional regulator
VAEEMMNQHETVGAWAKRYHSANRALIESVLRPYGLGSTQWYVLYQLANDGPTKQRDVGRTLHIERATLSGIVSTLVRKGFVEQIPDSVDQRQRVLRLTASGTELWNELPDPIATIQTVSLTGLDDAALETTIAVLKAATRRINDHMSAPTHPDKPSASARLDPLTGR